MKIQRLGAVVFFLGCFSCIGVAHAADQVGTMPVPTLQGVTITANVTYDVTTQLYTYSYAIQNGVGSTGSISGLDVDMASSGTNTFSPNIGANLLFTWGLPHRDTFDDEVQSFGSLQLPPSDFLVPFGMSAPRDWMVGLTVDGYADFGTTSDAGLIQPGSSLSGLQIISPGAPTLREMVIEPWWVPVFDEEPDETEKQAAGQTEQDIRLHIQTLAPAGSTYLNWGDLESVLTQMAQLGWITDTPLLQQLQGQLDAANAAAVQEYDGTKAKAILQSLLTTLAAVPATAMNAAARNLITLDTQALIHHTPVTPIPVTRK